MGVKNAVHAGLTILFLPAALLLCLLAILDALFVDGITEETARTAFVFWVRHVLQRRIARLVFLLFPIPVRHENRLTLGSEQPYNQCEPHVSRFILCLAFLPW